MDQLVILLELIYWNSCFESDKYVLVSGGITVSKEYMACLPPVAAGMTLSWSVSNSLTGYKLVNH